MAITSKLHSSSLLYLVICSMGVIAFCLVGIFPNFKTMEELDGSIINLNAKVQRQELLFPIYSQLIKTIQHQAPDLPIPQKTKLPQKEITQLNQLFNKMAQKRDVIFESASPDAASYLEDSGFLTMNLIFHGDFFKFRDLILDICQLPYLGSIDELSISPGPNGNQMRLKIKLDQE